MIYNTIIIGAGAAGLFAGARLKSGNNLILEAGKRAGEKLLITGGGMCNITNMDDTDAFLTHWDKKQVNFLKPSLLNWGTEKTRDYLTDNGLPLLVREDGKVFPESKKAQSYITTLLREVSRNNTPIHYNRKVRDIERDGDIYNIDTTNGNYHCKTLLIATGGLSFPETGSDGSLNPIIKKLGHCFTPLKPALTGIKVENYPFKELAGSGVRATLIDFYRDKRRYHRASGDILFTHLGLSGPLIINNSRSMERGDELVLSLIPTENREETRAVLQKKLNAGLKYSIKRLLKEENISTALVLNILHRLKIKPDTNCNQLSKKDKKSLLSAVTEQRLTIKSIIGFNAAMVTAGGIKRDEINRKTMESKLVSNLFFAGEVIDIDGDTGGYNIQAAISTAELAVREITKRTKKEP